MKTLVVAVAAALGGIGAGAGLFSARPAIAAAGAVAEPQPVTTTMTAVTPAATSAVGVRASGPAIAGTVQVTRLTDTSFVVVKDQGDAEVVTLFSTEGGIVQKKHSGRFFF